MRHQVKAQTCSLHMEATCMNANPDTATVPWISAMILLHYHPPNITIKLTTLLET